MNKSQIAQILSSVLIINPNGSNIINGLSDKHEHFEMVQDIIRSVHGDMMPDDYKYKMVSEIADVMTDTNPEEWEDIDVKCMVDCYNGELLQWVSSNLTRAEYVNFAVDSLYNPSNEFDMFHYMRLGQMEEYTEVLLLLISAISDWTDEEEDSE